MKIKFDIGYSNAYGRKNAQFITSDKKVQDAIESHPWFGRDFYLAYTSKEETPTIDTVTEFEHVKTLREAQEVLELNFKVEHSDITTKAKLFAVANKLNVKFPNFN